MDILPLPFEFDVTRQDLIRSQPGNPYLCALAFAAGRATGYLIVVRGGALSIRKMRDGRLVDGIVNYWLSMDLFDWIQKFDLNPEKITPIRVRLITRNGENIAEIIEHV